MVLPCSLISAPKLLDRADYLLRWCGWPLSIGSPRSPKPDRGHSQYLNYKAVHREASHDQIFMSGQ
jgi:hypothetical protein